MTNINIRRDARARTDSFKNTLLEDFTLIFEQAGQTIISPSAYDTAWVARLGDDTPLFPDALVWLTENQNDDGSWGNGEVLERLTPTLGALIAFRTHKHWGFYEQEVEAGVRYIRESSTHLANGTGPLDRNGSSQPAILPVAFELVLATLLQDALALGLDLPENLADRFEGYRQEKLKKLAQVPPENLAQTSIIHGLEFCGSQLPAAPENFVQLVDGGVGISPAATACVYMSTPPEQVYLRERMYHYFLDSRIQDGGGAAWPVISCIDTFEWIWAYYNLHLWKRRTNSDLADYPELQAQIERCLRETYNCWSEKTGLGTASLFLPDSDSMALAYLVLQESGYKPDVTLAPLATYWREPGYLVTYGFERDPSTSANIHALEALTVAGNKPDANLLVNFLEEQRRGLPFWQDKWHISPYYPTSHALAAYCRLDAARATSDAVVEWIKNSQNPNGSWGWETRQGTMEETAYALQALMVYAETYEWSEDRRLAAKAGAEYLRQEYRPFEWEEDLLWISKTRYSPLLVVHSTVLSALLMAEEHRL
jgi:halimadienyl-diphosphate synthase